MGRDTITKAIYLNKALNWRLVYSFRGRVHTHHGPEQGSGQLGMALEQEVSGPQAAGRESIGRKEEERGRGAGQERDLVCQGL